MNSTMLYQEPSRAFHNLPTDFSMMNIHQTNSCGPGQSLGNGYDSSQVGQNNAHYWQDRYPAQNVVSQKVDLAFESRQPTNTRRSSNMTETVTVPSSEHVAEIVGRQGCKIKTLRAKTNTYIKTPIRGAEPAFVITGRLEDVAKAKHEIMSAAAHFSQLRSSRQNASANKASGICPSPPTGENEVKAVVRVPYKFVGVVIGLKGTSIKRIQQLTSTHISTPGLNQDPVFEITGQPQNVEQAKTEIEKLIASRAGPDNQSDLQIDNFHADSGYDQSIESPRSDPSVHSFDHVINMNDNLPPLSDLSKVNSLPSDHRSTASNCSGIFSNEAGDAFSRPFDSFISENGRQSIPTGVSDYFKPSSIWADSSSYLTERIVVQENESGSMINPNVDSDPIIAALSCFSQSSKSSSGTSSPGGSTIPAN